MSGITVSGRGEVSGVPDTLTVSVGVSVLRNRVNEAAAVAADRAAKVIAALEAKGVAESDMHTRNYSIGPQWDHRGDEPRITGYRVDNTLSIAVRDVSAAGGVIDAVVAAGGDDVRINGVAFSVEDDAAMVTAARAAAWHDAFARASQLADLAGVSLGPPTMINETFGHSPAPVMRAAAMERSPTPIAPGEQTVNVALTVVFAIES